MKRDVIQAVLNEDLAALRKIAGLVELRASADLLIKAIPHWLYKGDGALHLAAAGLREKSLALLLKAGADPNAVNRRGATPLHYACDPRPDANPQSQAALIGRLLKAGADVDRADKGGATPLHRAVRARSVEAVRTLLAAGASARPLQLAAHTSGASGTAGSHAAQVEIIRLLS
jgi:ankyrin repeat protein